MDLFPEMYGAKLTQDFLIVRFPAFLFSMLLEKSTNKKQLTMYLVVVISTDLSEVYQMLNLMEPMSFAVLALSK